VGPIVTLLTDFGVESTYPAQMKGVILERCPEAMPVDLSHGVPRHDVRTASFMLAASVEAFPDGTVHVAVVDPQVGTPRRVLAATHRGSHFVAPDNGLLTVVLRNGCRKGDPEGTPAVVSVENASFFRTEVSSTFHGRDIFAPVAAAMACGTELEELGPRVDDYRRIDMPSAEADGGEIRGEVLYIDPFGNLVTNIPATELEGIAPAEPRVRVAGAVIDDLSRAYSDVPAGMLLAYVGSAGLLEVAVNRQSAATRLGAEIGTPVVVQRPDR
jgi:hypothetical protein